MELKKGMFFTIDGLIASGVIIFAVILISGEHIYSPANEGIGYSSLDSLMVLSHARTGETQNPYLLELIADGSITDLNNTILVQIGDFVKASENEKASKLVLNITESLIPAHYSYSFHFENYTIAMQNRTNVSSLVSSRTLVSSKSLSASWGPSVAEMRVWT